MLRILLIILVCFLFLGLIRDDESTATSPSPQGDTRMGADAAGLGKDMSEDVIQAQEVPIQGLNNEAKDKAKNPTSSDVLEMDVK